MSLARVVITSLLTLTVGFPLTAPVAFGQHSVPLYPPSIPTSRNVSTLDGPAASVSKPLTAQTAHNDPPPAGAILDLNGTPLPGNGNGTYQQYSVNFTATVPSTAITVAIRDDPAFISFANTSVTDLTNPNGNLLVNGDFSGGTYNDNGNPNTPNGWTYANTYHAESFGGVQSTSIDCYTFNYCWYDGAVQAYDLISQTIPTNVGDIYQIAFSVAENSGCSEGPPCAFSDVSTNGDVTDTHGNGIDVTVYAQAGVPLPAGPFAYVPNMGDKSVSVIQIPTGTVVSDIAVGSGPWGAAISPDQTQVYVTNSQDNTVSVIDTASNTVLHTIQDPTFSSPMGLAFTPDGKQAYVVNGSSTSVSVIDTATQTVGQTVTVQNSPVGVAMALTSSGTFAFVANSGSNSVSAITVGSNPTVQNITANIGTGPHWVAVTPGSRWVYVENAGSNNISVIDVTTCVTACTVTSTIPQVGTSPYGVAFTPDSNFAYVASTASNSVAVIDTKSTSIVTTVPNIINPSQIALTADGSTAYVTNQNSNTITVIDTASNTMTGTVTVGTAPLGVAMASAPQTELQITQPLSPTQPNTFDFGTANYVVQYPQNSQFSGVNMTVTEQQISQAQFQQKVVGTQFANAACIVYVGTGGNCVDHVVTCSDTNGNQIVCPTGNPIELQTSFTAPQPILNPGYLNLPAGQSQWQNIFSGFYGIGQLATVKGKTTGFTDKEKSPGSGPSEFVAVDLGAGDPGGPAQFQILSPIFPVTYPQGQRIPISIRLTSVDPPYPAITNAQAGISVVMIADGNGNPTQELVLSKVNVFTQGIPQPGDYAYTLDATAYTAGTYRVTIYGDAFPAFQGDFTILTQGSNAVLVAQPTSLGFGQLLVGMVSGTLRASLFNRGSVPGVVTSVLPTGDFQIQTNRCMHGVKPGTHCDVYVTFSPTALGLRTGTLTFTDNAPNSPQTVILSGTGTTTTTTKLTSSPNPSRYGQAVTLTATVTPALPGTPTGSVTFYDGANSLGSVALPPNGSAALTRSALTGGNHSLTASYSGDKVFLPSTSAVLVQTVKQAAVTIKLSSSMNPSHVGQPVTFSVVVTGIGTTPTGSVTFKQGKTVLGSATLANGQASLTTTFPKVGTFSIVARYLGDPNYLPRSSNIVRQTVQK